MKKQIPTVKGARDFYPEQMSLRNWLYENMKAVSQKYGYQEYDGPFLETLELYAAKSGEELVKEQAFVFNDRGGEQITLRPELTPSLARMVATRAGQLPRPIRWWSFGPMWRYERPQKGRSREFFQWNIDILGTDSIEADAEIAAIGAEFFRAIGLTPAEVKIQINNRKLMSEQIAALGVADIKPALKLIDRIEKLSAEAWAQYGVEQGFTASQTAGLRTLLGDKELWRKSDELIRFFDILDSMGVREYFEYEPSVVRGLDYYTRTVMEARDRDGEFRAILGGGRYDNLVSEVGSDQRISGVGFAMGDMVIGLVAAKYGRTPTFAKSPALVLVTVFGPGSMADSLRAARSLRESGLRTETYPEAVKLDRQLKYADAQGIRLAVIIGPDEAAAGMASVKDLKNRAQFSVSQADLPAKLREILDSPLPS
ncbi:MAG: histidine--tRNA ligase [Chloroflexi bacterium]|nr:histidine--tRNA ligase [Chloroflexota bacterium]